MLTFCSVCKKRGQLEDRSFLHVSGRDPSCASAMPVEQAQEIYKSDENDFVLEIPLRFRR